jgi:cytochrome oxidase Cu insertion factor (SCO1/SenC/PrrC family)
MHAHRYTFGLAVSALMITTLLTFACQADGILSPAALAGKGSDRALGTQFPLHYPLPKPGTYRLPPIQHAGTGKVIDADGTERDLSDYLHGKYVLLSFIFTRCPDPRGCPYATLALHQLAAMLHKDTALKDKVRLVSLSFDPDHDTPQVMQAYAKSSGQSDYLSTPWQARPWNSLQPVLDSFGQSVIPLRDARGEILGFSHVLKVYLIDEQGRVRNIYSTSFLNPALILDDIRTLAMTKES